MYSVSEFKKAIRGLIHSYHKEKTTLAYCSPKLEAAIVKNIHIRTIQ
jgi:hypothetical protein